MVSLYDIVETRNQFGYLATSIPRLNKQLKFSYGIHDIQSTPVNLAVYEILVELMLCHLEKGRKVIILNCLCRFPWNLLTNHPRFDIRFKNQLCSYTTDTYSILYQTVSNLKSNVNAMVIINNVYELLELYKLELSATYEEFILKLQIERNSVFLSNKQKSSLESSEALPDIPTNSDLLQSPVKKFDSHVSSFINNVSNCCQNSLVFLVGNLATNYKPYPKRYPNHDSSFTLQPSQNASLSNPGRVVLEPCTYFDNYINCRMVFFRDWYYNTGHFQENYPLINGKVVINQSLLRWVYGIKINDVKIYFDNDDGFYDDEDNKVQEKEEAKSNGKFNFIDLTGGNFPVSQELDLANNRSELFDAIQQASNRLSKSQVLTQQVLPENLEGTQPAIRSDGILETSTQNLLVTGNNVTVREYTLSSGNDTIVSQNKVHGSSTHQDTIVEEPNGEDFQESATIPRPNSPSEENFPLTSDRSTFLVTNDNGIIHVQFLKPISESQYLVVEESEDEIIGSLLSK